MMQALLDRLWARAAETWEDADMLVLADVLLDAGEDGWAAGVRHIVATGKCPDRYAWKAFNYWWDGAEYNDRMPTPATLEPFMSTAMTRWYPEASTPVTSPHKENNTHGFATREEALRAYARCYLMLGTREGPSDSTL